MVLDAVIRREKKIVIVILLFCGVVELFLWWKTNGFPTALDQAEPFLSFLSAENFARFGIWNLRFLEEYATSSPPVAHPYFYTHNGNFPTFISFILLKIGVSSLPIHNLLAIPIFVLGLWYLYAAMRSLVNPLAGIAVLVITATNYLGALAFGFNLYRAWTWIFIWGTIYHLKISLDRSGGTKRFHLLFAGLFLFLTAYYEYSLALFLTVIILMCKTFGIYKTSWTKILKFIGFSTLPPFLIHTLLAAWALGWSVCFKDLAYTFSNRAFGWPARELLQQFYDKHDIVLWGYPGFNLFNRLTFILLKDGIRRIETTFGHGCLLLALGWVGVGLWKWARFRRDIDLKRERLILVFFFATFLIFIIMPAHFYYLYLVSMPFMIFFMDTVRGITLARLLEISCKYPKMGLRIFLLIMLIGYSAWILQTQYKNATHFVQKPFPASNVLHKYRGYSFITNYQPAYVHYFTKEWAYIVGWYGKPIVEPFDSPYIFERDKLDNPQKYGYPDFFLWINAYNIPFPLHMLRKYPLMEWGEDFVIVDLRARKVKRIDPRYWQFKN